MEERLRYLVRWFSVEVFAYAVVSNHLHVVLRNNPKRVRGWDDREVARRWLHIFPVQVDDRGNPVVSEAAIAGNNCLSKILMLPASRVLGSSC